MRTVGQRCDPRLEQGLVNGSLGPLQLLVAQFREDLSRRMSTRCRRATPQQDQKFGLGAAATPERFLP